MELRQLDYFLATAAEENLTRAARTLNMTQPALSVAISKLEEELGCALFDRSRGKILLNPAGREFLIHVNRILEDVRSAQAAVARVCPTRSIPIRIGSSQPGICSAVAIAYIREHPEARFSTSLRDDGQLSVDLERSRLDFAITEQVAGGNFVWTPLLTERYKLFVREGHPLAAQGAVTLSDLDGQDFILYQATAAPYEAFPYGFAPGSLMYSTEVKVVLDMVAAGLGLTLLPEYLASQFTETWYAGKICKLTVKGLNLTRMLGILYDKSKTLSEPAREAFDFTAEFILKIGSAYTEK